MPSVSKAQQRFMGLVHAYKKGEVPASKVSKAVKDAAKSMKKKSTKDFAKTKHKGLPNKVRSENMNEAIEPQGNIKKVLDINKTKTAKKIGGTLVDITTANMMSQVWDKVNDKSKEKMNKMNTKRLSGLILRIWKAMGTPRV